MNSNVKAAIAFIVGAGAGAVVMWKLIEAKYRKQAQDEIEEVREFYANRTPKRKIDPKEFEHSDPEPEETVTDILNDNGYAQVDYTKIEKGELKTTKKPYVITPEEFGSLDGYDVISLKYFADGTLTDDWLEPVADVENTVGTASLTRFGEYVDDCVYVRNDDLGADYEILIDLRDYSEAKHDSD